MENEIPLPEERRNRPSRWKTVLHTGLLLLLDFVLLGLAFRFLVLPRNAGIPAGDRKEFGIWIAAAVLLGLVGTLLCMRSSFRAKREGRRGSGPEESESGFFAVLKGAPDGILMTDEEGRILVCNEAALEIFQREREEVEGGEITLLFPRVELSGDRIREWGETIPWEHESSGYRVFQRELLGKKKSGEYFPVETSISRSEGGGQLRYAWIFRDISERKLHEVENQRLRTAVEAAREEIVITDRAGLIQFVNPAFEKVSGYSKSEVVGKRPNILKSGRQKPEFYEEMWRCITEGEIWTGRLWNRRKNGNHYFEEMTISPIKDEFDRITNFVAVKKDITEQTELEAQLHQAQKLESIGQLAAGIAHEINTPTQYVGDNTRFLQESFEDLLPVLQRAREWIERELEEKPEAEELRDLAKAFEEADLEYLQEEIPKAIEQSLAGVGRVSKIVAAMKSFSHPGVEDRTCIDINESIRSTVTVATNEWKYVATVDLDFDENLPQVPCFPGEFNQVILNLIVNAAHAIEDKIGDGSKGKGKITITTLKKEDRIEIRVTDTGTGIPVEVQERVFDPFFTTKEVGKGTGQGLNIAHNVIGKKHGGIIDFETKPGEGTTFFIQLPLDPEAVLKKDRGHSPEDSEPMKENPGSGPHADARLTAESVPAVEKREVKG